MTNRIPKISASKQICIVCEGNEEYKYLERPVLLGFFGKAKEIISSFALVDTPN